MLMMPLHPQCLPKQQNNNFDDNKCLSIKVVCALGDKIEKFNVLLC